MTPQQFVFVLLFFSGVVSIVYGFYTERGGIIAIGALAVLFAW